MGFDIDNIRNKVHDLRNLKDAAGSLFSGAIEDFLPKNPQKTYLWDIDIIGDNTNIKTYAKSIVIPQASIEPIVVNYMGERVFYAGKETSTKTVVITFWDDERGTILRYLENWFTEVHENGTGHMLSERDYRRTIKIMLTDSTDLSNTSITELSGAFIIDIAETQLSYETSDVIEISATFQYELKDIAI